MPGIISMKAYKAVFFDWDGTAVLSRNAPVDDVCKCMAPLLEKGIPLAIISGTTYEKIAGGRLHEHFTPAQLANLYLGLGRGAFDYGFDLSGKPIYLAQRIPPMDTLLRIHRAAFDFHCQLLTEYGLQTDIVFSRPNYCKLDLMVGLDRGDTQFLQDAEIDRVQALLMEHGCQDGLSGLIHQYEKLGQELGLHLCITSDAKFLEAGITGKNTNADSLLVTFYEKYGIEPQDCAFWGDEFVSLCEGVFGSDSLMITQQSRKADFFDVSAAAGLRPSEVKYLGGGVPTFLHFLADLF